VTVAAAVYEVTPIKRAFRRRCRETVRSGFELGLYCVGSSIGLMVMLVAVGVMSIAWMSIVGAVVLAQKVLPPRAYIDVPVGVAILALGSAIVVAPSRDTAAHGSPPTSPSSTGPSGAGWESSAARRASAGPSEPRAARMRTDGAVVTGRMSILQTEGEETS
jgi:hypothetical protein